MQALSFCDRLASSMAGNMAATHPEASCSLGSATGNRSSNIAIAIAANRLPSMVSKCFASFNPFNDFMNPPQWILML